MDPKPELTKYVLTLRDGDATENVAINLAPTGRPTAFEMIDVGLITLPDHEVRLSLHSDSKLTESSAIHLRSIRLFPIY